MATMINSSTVAKVNVKIDRLVRELGATRAENGKLRAMLSKQNRYSSIVLRAITDAHTILMAAFSDEPTSRSAMAKEGMSQRRWEWAVAFLRYAGIVTTGKDWRSGLNWQVRLLDDAVELLEKSARELDGERGYKRLRALVARRITG